MRQIKSSFARCVPCAPRCWLGTTDNSDGLNVVRCVDHEPEKSGKAPAVCPFPQHACGALPSFRCDNSLSMCAIGNNNMSQKFKTLRDEMRTLCGRAECQISLFCRNFAPLTALLSWDDTCGMNGRLVQRLIWLWDSEMLFGVLGPVRMSCLMIPFSFHHVQAFYVYTHAHDTERGHTQHTIAHRRTFRV